MQRGHLNLDFESFLHVNEYEMGVSLNFRTQQYFGPEISLGLVSSYKLLLMLFYF